MARRSAGHPVGFAIVLQIKRRRHLDGPHVRAMTIREKAPERSGAFFFALYDFSVIIARNAHGLVDLLIFDRVFQHHAAAHLADMLALNFLPGRL